MKKAAVRVTGLMTLLHIGTGDTATIVGCGSPDTIVGTADSDLLFGWGDCSGVGGTPPPLDPNGGGMFDDDYLLADTDDEFFGNDTVYGGGGDDTLDGGRGEDTLDGGCGDDVYVISDSLDTIIEREGGGYDRAFSRAHYALDDNAEHLELAYGSGAIAGAGNRLDNWIIGNEIANRLLGSTGDDTLDGGLGDDFLLGGPGRDLLNGGEGPDLIVGGLGSDTLSGGSGNDTLLGAEAGKFSSIIAPTMTTGNTEAWLADPGLSFVEAYVRFEPDLSEQVLFGIDQEMFEGVDNPDRVAGADWMGLTGITRDGRLWVDIGTPEEIAGIPDAAPKWQTFDLGAALQPDTWYRLESVVDFGSLEFVSFTIEGPGMDVTVDLSGLRLSYPFFMPFDKRFLGFFVWTSKRPGEDGLTGELPVVFFDDVSGGITSNNQVEETFSNSFEDQDVIPQQPLSYPIITLSAYEEGRWYAERGGAVHWVENSEDARTGSAMAALIAVDNHSTPSENENDLLNGGIGNDSLVGDTGNDTLLGHDGDDTLGGGSGADFLIGGPGNDMYVVSDHGDMVVEEADQGLDYVFASINYDLGDNVEVLVLEEGFGAINGTGNGLDNALGGNASANVLSGGAGSDTLIGAAGDDMLAGDIGNDSLMGGDGVDFILGGLGEDLIDGGAGTDFLSGNSGFLSAHDGKTDTFRYTELPATPEEFDVVDFDSGPPASGGDLIDLSALFVGTFPHATLFVMPDGEGNSYVGIDKDGEIMALALILGVADPNDITDDNIKM